MLLILFASMESLEVPITTYLSKNLPSMKMNWLIHLLRYLYTAYIYPSGMTVVTVGSINVKWTNS